MKTTIVTFALATLLTLASTLTAQTSDSVSYFLFKLNPLGGTIAAANTINNRGWVMGTGNLAGDETAHATVWILGRRHDLGTLGGPNSAIAWPVKNNRGLVAGISETSIIDPFGETWSCRYFFPAYTGHTCQGFAWKDNVMTALPTLGGSNGYASGVNNLGQIVGWAENTVHDTTCNPPQVLQFEAVLYGPNNQITELPPLPGDPDGAATAINDSQQVVGISGICSNAVGGASAAHAVLWENGMPTDLGSLGGSEWNTPTAINKNGDIVGFSDLPGDENGLNFHAFLWTASGGMEDLGALPGHAISEALGINDRGLIVGESCVDATFTDCKAVIWHNKIIADLNTLVPRGSMTLVFANDINSSGEIAGGAFDPTTEQSPAFLAVPTLAGAPPVATGNVSPSIILPRSARRQLLQRLPFLPRPGGQ